MVSNFQRNLAKYERFPIFKETKQTQFLKLILFVFEYSEVNFYVKNVLSVELLYL